MDRMNRSNEGIFQMLKKRTSDENSKKTEKRKLLEHKRRPKKMVPATRQIDMKPVKVLVERTKLNEMFVFDRSRNTSKTTPLKLVNGCFDRKKNRKSEKKTQPKSASRKTHINALFRIRKCYVKIPKDKVLIRQLTKLQKRSRGRPRKRLLPADNEFTSTTTDPPAQKRKKIHGDVACPLNAKITQGDVACPQKGKITDGDVNCTPKGKITQGEADSPTKGKTTHSGEAAPPKRKSKEPRSGFFISVRSLTSPSSRRKVPKKTNNKKQLKRRLKKPVVTKHSPAALRHKYGSRFFKSYVKVKRITDATCEPKDEPKKKKGKNLSVSFLETVEIFGETSDSDEWVDFDDGGTPSPIRGGTRLKQLENGDTGAMTKSTSTPYTEDSSPAGKKAGGGGILKRREKISFSPLKEDENSPRREQLKRANEKIIRFDQHQQPAEEDDQPETTAPTNQLEADKETSTDASFSEDEKHSSNEANASSTSFSPNTELMTNSPLLEQNNSTENTNVAESDQKVSPAKESSLDKSTDEESSTNTSVKIKEKEDSFQSAEEQMLNDESHVSNSDDETVDPTLEQDDICGDLILSGTSQEDENHQTDKEETHSDSKTSDDEQDNSQEDKTADKILQTSQDNIFGDDTELVATVLLNDATEEDRNEAEAVLNDVCQIAAAESAALLNEADVGYNSRPNEDDDDFTSVLTHPEVERSLQSAASTLVPNSQEIVVAAAAVAASQAAEVDVNEDDNFASVVAEVERFTKDVNPEIYADDVGITGADVMMDSVQASNSLDDIFDDDDVDDDIISSLRMSSGNIDIGHDKSLPIQVIETEVMAIPNEPDLIFDKPLGTTASILGTSMSTTNDTILNHGHSSTVDAGSKMSLGRIFQSVKSYVMSPAGDKNAALHD